MHTRIYSSAALALLAFSLHAQAATLTPDQQAVLNKMLAQVPAEQRAMVRPQMEAMVSRFGKAQLEMMMAKMAESAHEEDRAPAAEAAEAGEWGALEAEYATVFPKVQAYIARVAADRDRMEARWQGVLKALGDGFANERSSSTFVDNATLEACTRALDLVPAGRTKIPGLEATHAEQDRIMTRLMVENRAHYPNLAAYARMVGQGVDSPMVAPVRYTWAAPLAEADVHARLTKLESDMAALLETNTRKLHKIYTTAYSDQGSGIVSAKQEHDLQAHRAQAGKAAAALCEAGSEAYERGLLQFLAPLAAKLK